MTHTQDKHSITAIVLAGGLGRRMGGVDKGLQPFRGKPLALHGLERLQAQKGDLIAGQMISANRHLPVYERFGVPVHADVLDGHLGPLAGFLTGLEHCPTPYLLTVPCDAPRYPLDLAQRLAQRGPMQGADIAIAATRAQDGHLIPQPVFSLLSALGS
jgi:molybdopterin-guanine dinucleotide biosynthesis protein A